MAYRSFSISYMEGTAFREPCPNSYYKVFLWPGAKPNPGGFITPLFFPGLLTTMEYLMQNIHEDDFVITKHAEPNHWIRGGDPMADVIEEKVAKRVMGVRDDDGDAEVKSLMEAMEKATVSTLPDEAKLVVGGDGKLKVAANGDAKAIENQLSALAASY
jgi:hypothetical protein